MKILNNFKNLFAWFSKPVNNKYHEFQLYYYLYPTWNLSLLELEGPSDSGYFGFHSNFFSIIEIEIFKNKEQDHAGFQFILNFFGLSINYSYIDIRHWDNINDKWKE